MQEKCKKDDNNKICIDINEEAWNKETYNAWIERFGTPKEAAAKIKKDPSKILSVLYSKFGDVKGKKIMNLMGSNGNRAVALALLGADATVVDFSEGNRQYALDLAKEANVEIEFILSDVLELNQYKLSNSFDIVFAEMGILHYFLDLKPFMSLVYSLLAPNGAFVLRDFHPVSTKLISSRGSTAKVRKHKVTGDYFDTTLEEKDAAYSKYLNSGEAPKVLLRKWNLGEIVTAAAESGLIIKSLDEEPNLSCESFDKGIPKTFTLVAAKTQAEYR
ncbi:class I SAM-dependent methyltransferase [Clostridium hydrogenum]|uniref:class I SAM-dependent methyltransferase n=1 Tax=Clostridium hydrogenum TaxID=2855764 RepID=UPI001F1D4A71|nr:class I SAM-dependent methyltransferase [Clostridium hydrogenum]